MPPAPTHHSFTFNLGFIYELKHKFHFSKTVYGIFHLRFSSVFIILHIFVQQNAWTLWVQNVIIPFKFKIIEKPNTILLINLWFLSCNKKFFKFNDIFVSWSSPKPRDKFCILRKSKFSERQFFSKVLNKYLTFLYLTNYLFL